MLVWTVHKQTINLIYSNFYFVKHLFPIMYWSLRTSYCSPATPNTRTLWSELDILKVWTKILEPYDDKLHDFQWPPLIWLGAKVDIKTLVSITLYVGTTENNFQVLIILLSIFLSKDTFFLLSDLVKFIYIALNSISNFNSPSTDVEPIQFKFQLMN